MESPEIESLKKRGGGEGSKRWAPDPYVRNPRGEPRSGIFPSSPGDSEVRPRAEDHTLTLLFAGTWSKHGSGHVCLQSRA